MDSGIFKLNDIEMIMKKLYKNKGKKYIETPITYEEYDNLLKYNTDFIDIRKFYSEHSINFNSKRANIEKLIKKEKIYVVKHERYGYPIWHNHNYIELIYIYSGKCTHYIENDILEMKTGDICILAPNTKHVIVATSDDDIIINIIISKEILNLEFSQIIKDNKIITQFFRNIIYNNKVSPYILLTTDGDIWIKNNIKDIYIESINKRYKYHLYIEMITRLLIIRLIRDYESTIITADPIHRNENDILERILSYIHANYNEVTLNSVAKYFNYNEAYLSRILKKNTGKTFSNIVMEMQMKKATELLKNTNMNLTDISQQIGCFDLSHLNRKFKKIYGYTPSEYRKKYTV